MLAGSRDLRESGESAVSGRWVSSDLGVSACLYDSCGPGESGSSDKSRI